MQKWHIHSAIGKGRPVIHQQSVLTLSSHHYLHTTCPRAQEVHRDRDVTDSSRPPLTRAKRLQQATSSIENLYLTSAGHDNSRPRQSENRFRSVPSKDPSSDQRPDLASPRFGGVPLNREIIEGNRRAQSSDGGRFTMGRDVGREVNPAVLDTRSLGAQPGSSMMRKIWRGAPPSETRHPAERSVLQPGNLQGGNGGMSQPLRNTHNSQERTSRGENGFQQHPSPASIFRYTGAQGAQRGSQASQPRFTKDQNSFKPRIPGGEGRPQRSGRSRGGLPQASRDSDDSEPRRRRRGADVGTNRGDRIGRAQKTWTEEEKQYLKEKAERSQQPLEYEPVDYTRDTLTGMGPATASDEWGMSEMFGERLLLARKLLDREFIQWDSKEQKADVMAVAEKLKAYRKTNPTEGDKANTTMASGKGDQQAQALMQKLFGGNYDKFKRLGEKDVLGHVERYVHRNDSYYPDDEKSLLETVRSILPAEQASKAARNGKKEVR